MHAGAWDRAALAERLAKVLPAGAPDPARLAARIYRRFGEGPPPSVTALAAFMREEKLLEPLFEGKGIRGPSLEPYAMGRRPDLLAAVPLPDLPTLRDVGRWLGLSDEEVSWFADVRFRQDKLTEPKLHHYHYSWIPKRSGGLRLIEMPKFRLKEIQRRIVREILGRIPPHDCAHGFTRGRSIRTFAEPHTGQYAVLRLDLKDFFHSVPIARIAALFRSLGYPPKIARVLQGLCTNAISPPLAGKPFEKLPWHERKALQDKHLPQGAPSSAPLANLCAWRLDCRLEGLAIRYGYRYTRYADDLALSGPSSLARRAEFIEALVGAIATEEGFCLNYRKTRLRLSSQRQRLAGVVVNEKANCGRAEWDRLKATLHNCAKHGPEGQNRGNHPAFKSHLEGRVAHFAWLNPARGEKLKSLLGRIVW
ncbi:MAG: RNA-directed DNA polymerase [Alphaproteobacteria bacterium]|nr:RNA-directed DNA polymerase [Alphaproteobacteria bacterium]